jgi:hypothetical protein
MFIIFEKGFKMYFLFIQIIKPFPNKIEKFINTIKHKFPLLLDKFEQFDATLTKGDLIILTTIAWPSSHHSEVLLGTCWGTHLKLEEPSWNLMRTH